jgi:hypothetical protein
MNLLTPEVLVAVEGLYAAFAEYRLPEWTDPCLHCHSEGEERQLHAKPLRELDAEELRSYVGDALLVWGDAAVFKHFLPRILEIFVTSPRPTLDLQDPEMIFSKFRYGNWLNWPDPEQTAVRAFFHAFWKAVLADPPPGADYLDMESWLCSIAQAEEGLDPYLRVWLEDVNASACVALGQFICDSGVIHRHETGRNPFWQGRESQYKQVRDWIRSEAAMNKLARAEGLTSEADGKGQIQAALSLLGID